ncbi:pTP [White sturgeon adenovirus 1]|uniref:PTP n=1 Tax=White sturgeon adenovirus 1 TaxID=2580388 RepID=A0A4P8PIM7_9ADEN|nr:pTP [White sturgeon adenovirus 1]QCQ84151.1 pTP [White sturgeon adenovirus 1]
MNLDRRYARLTNQTVDTIRFMELTRFMGTPPLIGQFVATLPGVKAASKAAVFNYQVTMLRSLAPGAPTTRTPPFNSLPPPHLLIGYAYMMNVNNNYDFSVRNYTRLGYTAMDIRNRRSLFWNCLSSAVQILDTSDFAAPINRDFGDRFTAMQEIILINRVRRDLELGRQQNMNLIGSGTGTMKCFNSLRQIFNDHRSRSLQQMLSQVNPNMHTILINQLQSTSDIEIASEISRLTVALANYIYLLASQNRVPEPTLCLPRTFNWINSFVDKMTNVSVGPSLSGAGITETQKAQHYEYLHCLLSCQAIPQAQNFENFVEMLGGMRLRSGTTINLPFRLRPRRNGRAVTGTVREPIIITDEPRRRQTVQARPFPPPNAPSNVTPFVAPAPSSHHQGSYRPMGPSSKKNAQLPRLAIAGLFEDDDGDDIAVSLPSTSYDVQEDDEGEEEDDDEGYDDYDNGHIELPVLATPRSRPVSVPDLSRPTAPPPAASSANAPPPSRQRRPPPRSEQDEVMETIYNAIQSLYQSLSDRARTSELFQFARTMYAQLNRIREEGNLTDAVFRRFTFYFFLLENVASTLYYYHSYFRENREFTDLVEMQHAQVIVQGLDGINPVFNRVFHSNDVSPFLDLFRRLLAHATTAIDMTSSLNANLDDQIVRDDILAALDVPEGSANQEDLIRSITTDESQVDEVRISYNIKFNGQVCIAQKAAILLNARNVHY